jgi:hypothetical protein
MFENYLHIQFFAMGDVTECLFLHLQVVLLPAPLVWKKQVFPDSMLTFPEGLVKLIRLLWGPTAGKNHSVKL